MRRLAPILAALTLATLALLSLPASASAEKPWWQLLSGSRPSHLQVAPDATEVQELRTSPVAGNLAVALEVGGEAIGCLGAGAGKKGGLERCKQLTGFAPTQTTAELKKLLEGPYGGEVQLAGPGGHGEAPLTVAEGPFTVITPGRWVAPLAIVPSPLPEMGSGSVSVTSEGSGRLTITLTNLGNAPVDATEVPLAIADTLPEGAQVYGVRAEPPYRGGFQEPLPCVIEDIAHFSCTLEGVVPPYEAIEVEVFVALKEGVSGEGGEVAVSGGKDPSGKAAPSARAAQTLDVSDEAVPFGLEYFSMVAEEEGGAQTTTAGSHPFQLTTTIVANSGPQSGADRTPLHGVSVAQPALPRNLRFTLPAGLVGNVTAVETCDMATFLHQTPQLTNECPAGAAIGVSSVTFIEGNLFGLARLAVPVFNLVPGPGEPARFGLMVSGDPVVVDTAVDPANAYRITAEVHNISQVVQFLASTTALWGNPGAKAHDASRGWNCAYFEYREEGKCEPPAPSERHEVPFLRMPVSCASPLDFDAAFEPWNVPIGSLIAPEFSESPPLFGCNRLPFVPTISNALTSKLAANPSGLDFRLDMPNEGLTSPKEGALSETQPKKVTVALPKGVTINPSQAEGLATCSRADFAGERFDSKPGEGCPEASKIGSVSVSTPLLEEEAQGALYVATPYDNPTGAMIALYLVAKIPNRGILVKQAGKVEPDPATGQLISTFDDVPQLPFSSFKLHFREGGRSPLITPPGCGTFHTLARFVPWSAQDPNNPAPGEVVERSEATFTIDHGVDGGACPSGPAPFHPGFEAGTLNNQAGSYSPFVMRLTRNDGEQDMAKFSSILPPGVVGKIAGIAYCPEAGIVQAKSRTGASGGREELDRPSCPAASQIGRTVAGAGVGSQLTYVGGSLYLAGPYHGDPLSVVSITPALAGPFDAGTVVVRIALTLNPVTGEVEADGQASDPIPHILKGIPLNVRDLRVYVDRPDFTLNATSCEEEKARATLFGAGTVLAPAPDSPVALSARYQAAGCASLGFKPKLAINLRGGTRRGGHPALKAVVTPRAGDANFAKAVVTLPHSAFLDQAHIRTICTRVQFAAGAGNGSQCPAGAVYGHAKAWTPLLDQPLEGPVFLRSSSHNLPDLVLALHGLVDIDLASRIDSVHGGIRSTFEDIPDAPVSRFVLEMQGGKKGLIVNSTGLCQSTNRAQADLTGQNGRLERIKPVVRPAGCGKAHRKHHRGRGSR